MPTARGGFATAAVNGVLFAVGGIKPGVTDTLYTTVEAYSPKTEAWETKASLPGPCAYGSAGAIDGIVYVVGCGSPTYTYDPNSNTWTNRAEMPTPRSGVAVAVLDGILYAIGGVRVGYSSTDFHPVEAYDVRANSWETRAPIPTNRYYACAGVIGGLIYVAGGARPVGPSVSESLATLEAYDPKTDTWTAKAPMPTARRGAACGVIGGELYVIAGSRNDYSDSIQTTVEAYNPQANSWRSVVQIPTPRFSPGQAAVEDTVYVVGGLDADNRALNSNEAFSPFLAVGIDLKPGDATNTINLRSAGTVAVAILGSATFDPLTVDPTTVTLAGAPVANNPKGRPLTAQGDFNHDGYTDLLLHFRTQDLQLTPASTEAVLYGTTTTSQRIRGSDSVRIIRSGGAGSAGQASKEPRGRGALSAH